MEQKLKDKTQVIKDFIITENKISMMIKQRKNWTVSGVNEIQIYWCKRLMAVWGPMCNVLLKWQLDNDCSPE